MFKILDGRSAFDQWDLGQKLTNDAMVAGDRVRFASSNGETGITYARDDGGTIVADVPNELLKTANPIVVQLGGGASWQCEHKTTFAVNPAEMPEGYECTDNTYTPDPNACSGSGVTSWNDLEDRPFGEEMTETLFFEGSNLTEQYNDVSGEDYPEGGTAIRVYCTGSSFGSFVTDTVWELNDDGYYITVDNDAANLHMTVGVNIPGSYSVGFADGSARIDGTLRVVTLATTIHPMAEKFLPDKLQTSKAFIKVFEDTMSGLLASSGYYVAEDYSEISPKVETDSIVVYVDGEIGYIHGTYDLLEPAVYDGYIMFGNEALLPSYGSGKDTGEVFCIMLATEYGDSTGYQNRFAFKTEGKHTVKITGMTVTEYLPDESISPNIARKSDIPVVDSSYDLDVTISATRDEETNAVIEWFISSTRAADFAAMISKFDNNQAPNINIMIDNGYRRGYASLMGVVYSEDSEEFSIYCVYRTYDVASTKNFTITVTESGVYCVETSNGAA